MKITIKGWKILDFISADGKPVKGTKLYVSFPNNGVTGEETAGFFIPAEKSLPKLVVGSTYMADFDNRGKLIAISEA